eukprot:1159792-Pelagomonas_calceolata.AAC.7
MGPAPALIGYTARGQCGPAPALAGYTAMMTQGRYGDFARLAASGRAVWSSTCVGRESRDIARLAASGRAVWSSNCVGR